MPIYVGIGHGDFVPGGGEYTIPIEVPLGIITAVAAFQVLTTSVVPTPLGVIDARASFQTLGVTKTVALSVIDARAAWQTLTTPSVPESTVAELPRIFIDSSYVPGTTVNVSAGADLQAAINAATRGQELVLAAGATFTGSFTLPVKSGTGVVTIKSAGTLPPEGTRVSPAAAANFAKLRQVGVELLFTAPSLSSGYRFMGLDIGFTPETTFAFDMIRLGDGLETNAANIARDFTFDRCYIHGHPNVSFQRAISLNSGATAIVDCYFSECHGRGFDSQCIAGWQGTGPWKIVNNYLEGAGENILIGGADTQIPNNVPSDIEIRRNHIFKPNSWRGVWTVKNLLELKNARRVLIEGNVLENNWTDAQAGRAVLFTVRNQDGTNPWATIEDVTYRNNILRGTEHGIHTLGQDYNHPSQEIKRIYVANNLIEAAYTNLTLGGGQDVQFIHNTLTGAGQVMILASLQMTRAIYRDNISNHGEYGVYGDGVGIGNVALAAYAPGIDFRNNLFYNGDRFSPSIYPPSTMYEANVSGVQFVDFAGKNYRLAGSSPYNNTATDGVDVGLNVDALDAATAGVVI